MGAAAAQIRLQLGADLLVGRLGIPLQQRLRPHHHAGDAIAALRRLLFHEGALDRRRRLDGAEPFQRRHLLAFEQQQRRHAGQHRLAVDDHRAGAALAEPAAEFGGVELDFVAQHVEQRRIRIGFDLVIVTIDLQCHHGLSRCVGSAGALCGPADVWRNTVWVRLASATVFSTPVHGGWLLNRARRNCNKRRDLVVVHAGGKARHDRAALALDRTNARQHDVDGIARIRAAERGARARD